MPRVRTTVRSSSSRSQSIGIILSSSWFDSRGSISSIFWNSILGSEKKSKSRGRIEAAATRTEYRSTMRVASHATKGSNIASGTSDESTSIRPTIISATMMRSKADVFTSMDSSISWNSWLETDDMHTFAASVSPRKLACLTIANPRSRIPSNIPLRKTNSWSYEKRPFSRWRKCTSSGSPGGGTSPSASVLRMHDDSKAAMRTRTSRGKKYLFFVKYL